MLARPAIPHPDPRWRGMLDTSGRALPAGVAHQAATDRNIRWAAERGCEFRDGRLLTADERALARAWAIARLMEADFADEARLATAGPRERRIAELRTALTALSMGLDGTAAWLAESEPLERELATLMAERRAA